jgi:hypothetical protein
MGETPEDAMEAAMSHCRSDVNATDCSIWDADTGECWTRYRDEIGYREWRWLPMEREGIYDLADWDPAEAVRLAYGD